MVICSTTNGITDSLISIVTGAGAKPSNDQSGAPSDGSTDQQSGSDAPPTPPPPPPKFPYYVSSSVQKLHQDMFQKTVDLILSKGVFFNSDKERRKNPFRFKKPEQLKRLVDFELTKEGLINENDQVAGQKKLLQIMESVIDFSPHPSHPFMVHKNSAGLDPYGIVGDWLSTTMSTPVLTYFLAPVFTLMEFEVEERFRNLLGYPKGQGDRMVTPGQGIGNSYCIQVALQTKFPKLKDSGYFEIGNPKAVMFVSEQGDYSYEKYCIWEGLGTEACIRVKTDNKGRMIVEDLSKKIQDAKNGGGVPFLIVATAGTNVIGAIDPIDEIAAIAQADEMWLHVDGHLAGSCVFSQKHAQRLKGIEKSDSCLWSPSKMLAAPFCTSIIVTRESQKLKKAFTFGAAYVFEQDPFYDHIKWDNGDNTLQTTRRPDIMKIWFMWKAKGKKVLGDQVDGTYENTALCVTQVKSRRGRFVLILDEFDSNLVCFYFVPEIIRTRQSKDIVRILRKNKTTQTIKNKLLLDGIMEISIGELPDRSDLPCFFIMNMNNTAVTLPDIKYMLDQIEYCGDRIILMDPFLDIFTETEAEKFIQIQPRDIEMLLCLIPPVVPPPPKTYPDYVSAPIESMHRPLFEEYFKVALELGTYFQDKRDSSPLLFQQPEQLLQKFDFSLETENGYLPVDKLMELVKGVIKYSVILGHPYFMFQLVAGLDPYTMVADYIAACMTSSMYTYEDGPVYTLMEDALRDAILKRAKFPNGSCLSLVGGSISNELPIYLASIKKFPKSKQLGNRSIGASSVIFLSGAAHYSTNKGAFFQGSGQNNCVNIKFDEAGKMDVEDLKAKVATAKSQGKIPFMVCATTGTTVLGAYDPVPEIADVCEQNGMWLHVDGAYGGSVIMSDAQSFRLKGLERADSFTFNPHKMFGAARYTTNWVTKHPKILRDATPPPSNQQFRLNQQLYDGSKYDHGEFYPLTDRRPDIFKMWILWKSKGQAGLGAHVDKAYSLTDYAQKRLLQLQKDTKRFQPSIQTAPECTNINFLYVPQQLLGAEQDSADFKKKITCVQNAIIASGIFKMRLVQSLEPIGTGDTRPNTLILCLYNSSLTEQDVDYFFKLIDYYGKKFDYDKLFQNCV